MIPYITEILYQRLNEIRPKRGLPGRLECPSKPGQSAGSASDPAPSRIPPLLIKAPWPQVGDFSEAAEHIFPKLQEVVGTIRNLRNQYNVPVKQPVTVSISAPAEPARQLTENREVIELLATCQLKEIAPNLPEPEGSVRGTAAGVDIFVTGLIDKTADAGRIAKQREDLMKKKTTLQGRLANESYIAKAPPKLVEETKAQLAAVEAELAKLGS
jgi:valyl-tRNA synthetase